MTTWQKGRRILAEALKTKSIPVTELIKKIEIEKPYRVQGTAIYMSSDPWGVPIPLLHNLRHNKVLHGKSYFLNYFHQRNSFCKQKRKGSTRMLWAKCLSNRGFFWV